MNSYFLLKRAVDIFGSAIGLIILALIYPLIGLIIKLGSPGPIMIKLERISEGKSIWVYKFRTMIASSHEWKFTKLVNLNERKDGPFFKIKNDPRITKTGKILRKFRLDEFPQLINVLKGELSLVGPRPHEPEETKQYPELYRHLLKARAGVTGLSQVSGASSLSFLKELELDDYYLKNQSLLLDFKIILKTLAILLIDPSAV